MGTTGLGLGQTTTTTIATTTGNIMGIGGWLWKGGYSTSSTFNVGQTTATTTGSIIGVGIGVGDAAIDITYSTEPDNLLLWKTQTQTQITNSQIDINNLQMYEKTTLLPEQI